MAFWRQYKNCHPIVFLEAIRKQDKIEVANILRDMEQIGQPCFLNRLHYGYTMQVRRRCGIFQQWIACLNLSCVAQEKVSQLATAYYLHCHPLCGTADKTNNGCLEEEYGTYNETASTLTSASSYCAVASMKYVWIYLTILKLSLISY